jgi:hypothetical protein
MSVAKPLKNFPTCYGSRRFITVFTRALQWVPARSILVMQTNFNIIFPPISRTSQWHFSSMVPHQYPTCIRLLSIRATSTVNLILLDLTTFNYIWRSYEATHYAIETKYVVSLKVQTR